MTDSVTIDGAKIGFSTAYAKDAEWTQGLREFFEYRDLGVTSGTGGQVRAHHLRVKHEGDTSTLHTTGLHRHELTFQMIYILKGWIEFVYHVEGEDGATKEEVHRFGPGDCCLQPPSILHNELQCSDDLELVEVTSPGNFQTKASA
ncbi:MAG: cupin domain-containing protein [Alphaproteobacteria bacterium]